MKIKEIIIHNVGVYRGRHTIDLNVRAKSKPVVLIGALNGCGKTTVLEALRLGLYGKLARSPRRGNDAYETYLRKLINKSVPAEEGAAVEVAFSDNFSEGGAEIRVIRTWAMSQGGRVIEKVEVYSDGAIASELSSTWDDEVERFFPQKLCSLFFFDGEEIEALADPARAKEIFHTAINSLLGLELVDRAGADLGIIGRKLRQGIIADDIRTGLESLDATIDEQMKTLSALAADRTRIGHQLGQAQELAKKTDEDFRVSGGDIFNELKKLEAELEKLKAKRQLILSELKDLAGSLLPLSLLKSEVGDLRKSLKQDLDIQSARILAADLKGRDSELLGWVIAQGWGDKVAGPMAKYMQDKRENVEKLASQDVLLEADAKVLDELDHVVETALPKEEQRLSKLLTDLKRTEKNMDALEHKITRAPSESAVMELALERTRSHVQVESLQTQLTSISDRQKALEIEKTLNEQKRDDLLRSAHLTGLQAEFHSRMANRTEQLSECLKKFKVAVLKKHVEKLEEAILDSYRKLLRKEGLVSRISIEPSSMDLTVYDTQGSPVPLERLSAGERQLLATSILWGLARSSGRALPVVIDTPLGRLDASHRERLVKHYFPDASHQVILLSTDEEINEKYYSQIKRHVGLEYQLVFDEGTGGSSVRPGYLFPRAA